MIDLNVLEKKISEILTNSCNKLLKLINNKLSLEIQAKVIKILAKSQLSLYEDLIIDFFNKNTHLEDAIYAIAYISKEKAVDALLEKVKQKTTENRDIITEQLGNYKNNPKVLEALKELLKDEDRHVRFQAINSLFSIGGKSAAIALCDVISDPDEWISMSALKALCKLKEHETIPFLAEQFKRDTDLRRKAQMVSFLSAFRSVTLVSIFDEGLKGKDARLKANSIEAIAELELPEREIKQRILPFLQDPNNRIRANAILALAKSEPELVRPEIIKMVESNDVQLRRSAAFILGKINPEKNLELAEKLISDPSADVRKRMVLSLNAFPKDFVQKQLEKTVSDPNKWIRKYSIEQAVNFPNFPKPLILRQLKLETAIPNIIACMKFFTSHIDEEALKIIKARLKDKNPDIACQAIKTISSIFGLKGLQAIASQINYKDPKILKEFVVNHFSLGGYEIFPTIIEKAVQIKNNLENPILDSIESCIEILVMKDQMPKPLLTEIIKQIERENELKIKPQPLNTISQEPIVENMTNSQVCLEENTELQKEALEKEINKSSQNVVPQSPKVKQSPHLIKAIKFFNLGKYSKAKPLLLEIIQNYPETIRAHFYLAVIYYEEKAYEKAKDFILPVIEKEPQNKKAVMLYIKILKKLREWNELVPILEANIANISNDEGEIKLLKDLSTAYIFCQQFEKAKVILEKIYFDDPSDYNAAYYLAMTYYHLNEFKKAEVVLKELINKLPKKHKLLRMAESLYEKIKSSKLQDQSFQNIENNIYANSKDKKSNEIPRFDDNSIAGEFANSDNGEIVNENYSISEVNEFTNLLYKTHENENKKANVLILDSKNKMENKSEKVENISLNPNITSKPENEKIGYIVEELVNKASMPIEEAKNKISELKVENRECTEVKESQELKESIDSQYYGSVEGKAEKISIPIKNEDKYREQINKTNNLENNFTFQTHEKTSKTVIKTEPEPQKHSTKKPVTMLDFNGIQENDSKLPTIETEQITLAPLSEVFKDFERPSNKDNQNKEIKNSTKNQLAEQSSIHTLSKLHGFYNKLDKTFEKDSLQSKQNMIKENRENKDNKSKNEDKESDKNNTDNTLDDIFKLPSL